MTPSDLTPLHSAASHPGNRHALRSGAFSKSGQVLAERAEEVTDAIMDSGTFPDIDRLGASELGAMVALAAALDADIAARGPVTRAGVPRKVVELRIRVSNRIERWLREYGATPAARTELAAAMATGGLAAEIARRRAEGGG